MSLELSVHMVESLILRCLGDRNKLNGRIRYDEFSSRVFFKYDHHEFVVNSELEVMEYVSHKSGSYFWYVTSLAVEFHDRLMAKYETVNWV